MPPNTGLQDAALRAREPPSSRDEKATHTTYTAISSRFTNAFHIASTNDSVVSRGRRLIAVPAALLPRGAIPPLLSELSSQHSCQTQFAACSGTPMPQVSSPHAMPRATPQLHLAIPSIPIQLPFHRHGGSFPGSRPVLPPVRCHQNALRFRLSVVRSGARQDPLHHFGTFSFTFTFSSVSSRHCTRPRLASPHAAGTAPTAPEPYS